MFFNQLKQNIFVIIHYFLTNRLWFRWKSLHWNKLCFFNFLRDLLAFSSTFPKNSQSKTFSYGNYLWKTAISSSLSISIHLPRFPWTLSNATMLQNSGRSRYSKLKFCQITCLPSSIRNSKNSYLLEDGDATEKLPTIFFLCIEMLPLRECQKVLLNSLNPNIRILIFSKVLASILPWRLHSALHHWWKLLYWKRILFALDENPARGFHWYSPIVVFKLIFHGN